MDNINSISALNGDGGILDCSIVGNFIINTIFEIEKMFTKLKKSMKKKNGQCKLLHTCSTNEVHEK